MNTDLPVIARLNPHVPAPVPEEGMEVADSPIRSGLPHVIPLGARMRGVLVLPTGLAQRWFDLPSVTLVSAGAEAFSPVDAAAPGPPFGRAAPRLRVQRDKTTIAVLPLAAGVELEAADAAGTVFMRMKVLDWAIHAGTVRGMGDFGSYLRLAFRVADRGADLFGPLPPSEFVLRRLPPAERIESRGGRRVEKRLHRLVMLKERLR